MELIERIPVLCKQGVTGSIPVTSTKITLLLSATYAAIFCEFLREILGALGAINAGIFGTSKP
jgi:hypothetical protein